MFWLAYRKVWGVLLAPEFAFGGARLVAQVYFGEKAPKVGLTVARIAHVSAVSETHLQLTKSDIAERCTMPAIWSGRKRVEQKLK